MTARMKSDQVLRIFLVDDHPIVREYLSQLLDQQPDLQVSGVAVDLPEALENIGNTRPDVVIADISLQTSNGLDLVKELRARGWTVPVLVLSMHEEALYAERALRAGANGYISKQASSSAILAALRAVAAGKIYLSPEISGLVLRRVIAGTPQDPCSAVMSLGDRELEVFQGIGRGYGTKKIADSLGLSIKTIETYRARIKEKLMLDDSYQLMRLAIQWVESYDTHGVNTTPKGGAFPEL